MRHCHCHSRGRKAVRFYLGLSNISCGYSGALTYSDLVCNEAAEFSFSLWGLGWVIGGLVVLPLLHEVDWKKVLR